MRRNVIDRLALLCTLHADGPRTLRLLREAGCTSIEMLGGLSAKNVGKLLGLPAAAARRLTREATRLHERLEPDLEQEELTYPAAGEAQGIKPAPANFRLEDPMVERANGRPNLGLRDQELMQRVIKRWNSTAEPDGEVEPEALERLMLQPTGPSSDASQSCVELSDHELRALDPKPPEIEPNEQPLVPVTLQPGDIDGLDPKVCGTLLAAEVNTLEELATCPADELSLRSGLPFTLARTLQFRAGKHLAAMSPNQAQLPFKPLKAAEERFSPSERPIQDELPDATPIKAAGLAWDDSGAAGPFA